MIALEIPGQRAQPFRSESLRRRHCHRVGTDLFDCVRDTVLISEHRNVPTVHCDNFAHVSSIARYADSDDSVSMGIVSLEVACKIDNCPSHTDHKYGSSKFTSGSLTSNHPSPDPTTRDQGGQSHRKRHGEVQARDLQVKEKAGNRNQSEQAERSDSDQSVLFRAASDHARRSGAKYSQHGEPADNQGERQCGVAEMAECFTVDDIRVATESPPLSQKHNCRNNDRVGDRQTTKIRRLPFPACGNSTSPLRRYSSVLFWPFFRGRGHLENRHVFRNLSPCTKFGLKLFTGRGPSDRLAESRNFDSEATAPHCCVQCEWSHYVRLAVNPATVVRPRPNCRLLRHCRSSHPMIETESTNDPNIGRSAISHRPLTSPASILSGLTSWQFFG